MTSLSAPPSYLLERHRDSMMASLNHRLEVARASNNFQLIQLLQQEEQTLSQMFAPPSRSLWQRCQSWLQALRQNHHQKSELEVSQVVLNGDRWWYAYDPGSGQSVYASSDQELMLWVNEHYQGH